jgi:hypothetical protein
MTGQQIAPELAGAADVVRAKLRVMNESRCAGA